MNVGVVITTYNHPAWLEKIFWGYLAQNDQDFTLIIADDGSKAATKEVIEKYATQLKIEHVWHEDIGFRKTKILNDAIKQTECDYLIFTDHDCLPRRDFIETHKKYAQEDLLLSAGYYKLTMPVSLKISREDIESQNAFDYHWLVKHGQTKSLKSIKLRVKGKWARFMDRITTTKATWNGANSSTYKKNIVAVNGFNEDMTYGGLDREMGERMMNNGITGKQIRHQAICLHLDHKRGYDGKETWERNRKIRQKVKQENIKWAKNGIVK
jgi:glycosyltransferase involved in cell wall biosynthesis